MRHRMVTWSAAAAVLLLTIGQVLHAGVIMKWDSGAGAGSTNWNDAANWYDATNGQEPSSLPGSEDNVALDATYATLPANMDLNDNHTVYSLTYDNTAAMTFRGNTSGTTARTLTIAGGSLSVTGTGNLTFSTTNGNANLALGAAGVFHVLNSGSTLTINSVLSGAGLGVEKTGAGTLVLKGTGNTFGGSGQTVAVSGGTLKVESSGSLGAAGTTVTLNGGTIDSSSSGAITISRDIIVNDVPGNALGGASGGNVTYSGLISGPGSLSKTGSRAVYLSNTGNTFGGEGKTVTITGNVLQAADDGALGDTRNSIRLSGGTLSYSYTGTTSFATGRAIALTAASGLSVRDGATLTVSGAVTGTSTLTLNGATGIASQPAPGNTSVVVFDGDFSGFTGGITLSKGTLCLVKPFGDILVGGLGGASNTSLVLDFGAQTAATLTLDTTYGAGQTYAGVLADGVGSGLASVTFVKAGAGTQTLTGPNTYTGATRITGGTLAFSTLSALGNPAPGQETIQLAGTLQYTGASALALNRPILLTGASTIDASGGPVAIDVASGNAIEAADYNLTLTGGANGIIHDPVNLGTGSITKTNQAGRWTLNAANDFSGSVNVPSGNTASYLISGAQGALGTGSIDLYSETSPGTLGFSASQTVANAVTIVGSTGAGKHARVSVADGVIATITGRISSGTGTTKPLRLWAGLGEGTLELTDATNNFTSGLQIYGGTLRISNNVAASGNSPVGTQVPLLGDTAGSANAAILLGGPYTMARSITVQAGSNGKATIGGATADDSIFSGPIAISKDLYLTAASAGKVTVSNAINDAAGSFRVTKVGLGTVLLTVANLYDGGTDVDEGTLLAGNASGSATGTGTVTVNAGGTLGGTGRIGGTIQVNAGGILAPGASLGELFADAGLIFGAFGTDPANFHVQVADAAADRLTVTGTLTIYDLNLSVTTLSAPTLTEYLVMTATGGIAVTGTVKVTPGWACELRGGNTQMWLVPEPATLTLVVLGGAAVVLGRRRRR